VEIAFGKLIRLQHVDTEISTTSFFLEAIPAKLGEIENQIKVAAEIVAHAKEKLSANQKKRRDLEGQVKDLKVLAGKFKRQLNDVKTNKEYSALLKEIEETNKKADTIEEEIINELIAADDIEKEIKSANAKKAEEESRLLKEKDVIFQSQKELEGKKEKLTRERQEILPQIPPDQLKLYLRINKKMNGVALSPVTDDFCSLCQMRIRPQILNELMEMNKIITCEACGRILYWQKPKDEEGGDEEKADNPDKVDESVIS
jgi:predicted  nucleic acid-binding Zn-ribbon protein